MDMFRKISRWVTDRSDSFIRGGEQSAQPQPEYEQAAPDANEVMGAELDPFGDGDQKYGGRQPYRSREDLEAEAERQAAIRAQQEAEAYQAQLQQQQEQYAAQQQAQYQQEQYAAQQQAQYQQQMQEQQYAAQQGYNLDNVIPFPGMQNATESSVCAHVEYIVQLTSRNECRTVIDYIRTNASVFLNMEAIENPSERQRCVDMLSGAAYALGCALNRISPRGVYLISSPSVRVMMDSATQKLASSPEVRSFARQSYEPEQARMSYAAQQAMPEEPAEPVHSSGFSSGSPTQRFQSQGAQGMPVSFSTAMAGSLTSTHRAVQAQRYNAQ